MTINYAPSAAGLSWLTLCKAIGSRAQMEGALFDIFANDVTLSIKQAQTQSKATKEAAVQESNGYWRQGLMLMAGAVVEGICAGIGYRGSDKLSKEAENIKAMETNTTALREIDPKLATAGKTVPSAGLADEKLSPTAGTATLIGKNSTDTASQTKTLDPAEENKVPTLTKEQKKKQKNLQNAASQFSNNANRVGQVLNQVVGNGVGGTLQSYTTLYRGEQNARQAIAQGLASALNNETSQMASALSSCDSYMQGTNQTLQTIISVSAVRG